MNFAFFPLHFSDKSVTIIAITWVQSGQGNGRSDCHAPALRRRLCGESLFWEIKAYGP